MDAARGHKSGFPAGIAIGTSGFSYKEWVGGFYPARTPGPRMLSYYAQHFSTVEINYTFRALPRAAMLEGWASQVPARFTFALKAPQRITHFMRLRGAADLTEAFAASASLLGERLGPTLFQLPPDFAEDTALLRDFTKAIPGTLRGAFEFRHSSWFKDTVFDALREAGCALCIADTGKLSTPLIATTDFVYLRLRKGDYTASELARWADEILHFRQTGRAVFAFLKHDLAAPRLAGRLRGLIDSAGSV